ncbi:hypothetical protein FACS1894191_1380 [Clostridia bacterium]|nr:hypothetical protein FACS1894191_1380 [Clostridia bacterium]
MPQPPGTYEANIRYTALVTEPENLDTSPDAEDNIIVDLPENLIPVTYTGTDTSPEWSKACTTCGKNYWHNYDEAKWANAVTVTAATRDYYNKAPIGTTIPESAVLSYYVYIPRYAYEVQRATPRNYQLCADGSYIIPNSSRSACPTGYEPALFNIQFQKNTDQKLTPYGIIGDTTGTCEAYAGPYETCAGSNNKFYTHPAFTYGTTELNGFWVPKFEMTNLTTNSKPTLASRAMTAADFATVLTASKVNNGTIGLMKNTEFAAISYLATSTYGRGSENIHINNSGFITGRSATLPNDSSTTFVASPDNIYYGKIGVHASTTNNVYGIYDLSGSRREIVAGNLKKTIPWAFATAFADQGIDLSDGSWDEVINFYSTFNSISDGLGNLTNYRSCDATLYECLGHAFWEGYAYNADAINMPNFSSGAVWITRGGNKDSLTGAGLFSLQGFDGYWAVSPTTADNARLVRRVME